ncbi:MAG: hypothetical protein FGM57_00085 [Candidatus Taylorbacteria bacterium]|nr:hypothetical protein [Candidatus Taylorbacteria bacterium]
MFLVYVQEYQSITALDMYPSFVLFKPHKKAMNSNTLQQKIDRAIAHAKMLVSTIAEATGMEQCHVKLVVLSEAVTSKVHYHETIDFGKVTRLWRTSTQTQSKEAVTKRCSLNSQNEKRFHQTVSLIYANVVITVTTRDIALSTHIAQVIGSTILFHDAR